VQYPLVPSNCFLFVIGGISSPSISPLWVISTWYGIWSTSLICFLSLLHCFSFSSLRSFYLNLFALCSPPRRGSSFYLPVSFFPCDSFSSQFLVVLCPFYFISLFSLGDSSISILMHFSPCYLFLESCYFSYYPSPLCS